MKIPILVQVSQRRLARKYSKSCDWMEIIK